MRKAALTLTGVMLAATAACGVPDSEVESYSWELEKDKASTSYPPKGFLSKVAPGGRSGSRSGSGSKPNLNKPPKFTQSKPAPKPTAVPARGYHYEWDCD